MKYREILKKGIFTAACGIIILTLMVVLSDVRNILEIIHGMDTRWIPLILCLIPLNYCVKCVRYHYYLKLTDIHVPVWDEVFSLLASSVMVITPGKVGEMLLRGYILIKKGYAVPMLTICAMTVADRLTEGLAMVILTITAFSSNIKYGTVVSIGAIFVLLTAVLQNKRFLLGMIQFLAKRLPKWANTMESVHRAYEQVYIIFKPVPTAMSVLLGIISCLCEAGVIYFTAISLGGALSVRNAVFAFSLSGIVGAISMIPGGIGVADGTIMGLLIWCGLENAVASMVTIVSRFSTMWLGVLVGCSLLLLIFPHWRTYKHSER